jgi:hypothetical protein
MSVLDAETTLNGHTASVTETSDKENSQMLNSNRQRIHVSLSSQDFPRPGYHACISCRDSWAGWANGRAGRAWLGCEKVTNLSACRGDWAGHS